MRKMAITVGVLNYGCGNIGSVRNAVEYIGYRCLTLNHPNDLERCSLLVLPGVGDFDFAVGRLTTSGFSEKIVEWVQTSSNKLIGICLGMQLLCKSSEESINGLPGLGIIDTKVELLKSDSATRLPNIGWSAVNFCDQQMNGFNSDYYFAHSYAVSCEAENFVMATSNYGDTSFASVITNRQNVFGCQFHPEKSHQKGLAFLNALCKR